MQHTHTSKDTYFALYLRKGISPIRAAALQQATNNVIQGLRAELRNARIWTTWHMGLHFYLGKGRSVTLDEMGQTNAIQQEYRQKHWHRFRTQIVEAARRQPDGTIQVNFDNGYTFYDTAFAHGKSRVMGSLNGTIQTSPSGQRSVSGVTRFQFSDRFTDPLNLREYTIRLVNLFSSEEIREEDLFLSVGLATEIGGDAYNITGHWSEQTTILL